jgi:accessory colonization factor AcfC
MKYLVPGIVVVALGLGIPSNVRAQSEITLLSPNPIEATINKLVADFEAKTGIHVKVTYGTGVSTRKTVASGFLSTTVRDSKAARALLDYLASREAAPAYEAAKIFPVR